jgi:mRNA interferase HicA
MKRRLFIKHLQDNGCYLLREGACHSWFINPTENRRSTVPRHYEISNVLIIKICRDLNIKPPK